MILWRVDFLWRVEFFKIGKLDFTFIREMRVVGHIWWMLFFLSGWTTKSIPMRIFAFKAQVGIAIELPELWQLGTWMNYYSTKAHSLCKQFCRMIPFSKKWQLMSALASLERFGENDTFFKKWRWCRTVYSMNWF